MESRKRNITLEHHEKRQAVEAVLPDLCLDVPDLVTRLARFGDLILQYVADLACVDLVEDDGVIKRYLTLHLLPDKQQALEELRRISPMPLTGAYGYPRVIKTGKSQFLPGVTPRLTERLIPGEEARKLAESVVFRSFICVPLIAHDRILGALTVSITERPAVFTAEDLHLVELIARYMAECLDRT